MLNVAWANDINGREAFAYLRGFPGLFLMTQRRALVVAEFEEKHGWFKKKTRHRLCYEASLDKVKECVMNIDRTKKLHFGYISFTAHGDLADGSVIHFMKADPVICGKIKEFLNGHVVKKPVQDSGIALFDENCPPLENWLNDRLNEKIN